MSNINIWIGQLTANSCHASIEDFQEILGLLEDEEHGDKKEAIAIVKDIIRKVNTQSEAQALQQQLQDQLQIEESDEEDDGMVERHLLDNALAKIEEQSKFINDGSKRFKHYNDVYLRLSDNLNARIEVLEKSLEEQVSVTTSMGESNANLHRDNHQLKQQLSKLQKEFDELCKEYDALCKSEGGDIDEDGRASKRVRRDVTSSSTGEKDGEKDNMEEGEKDGEKDDEMSDVSEIKEVEDSSAIVESGKGGMDIDKDKPSEEEEAKDSEEEAAGGAVGDTEDREGRTSTPRTRRGTSSLSKDTEEDKEEDDMEEDKDEDKDEEYKAGEEDEEEEEEVVAGDAAGKPEEADDSFDNAAARLDGAGQDASWLKRYMTTTTKQKQKREQIISKLSPKQQQIVKALDTILQDYAVQIIEVTEHNKQNQHIELPRTIGALSDDITLTAILGFAVVTGIFVSNEDIGDMATKNFARDNSAQEVAKYINESISRILEKVNNLVPNTIGYDLNIEPHLRGVIRGGVKFLCPRNLSEEREVWIDCNLPTTVANAGAPNIHKMWETYNPKDGTVSYKGVRYDIKLTVSEDVDYQLALEKRGNDRETSWTTHELKKKTVTIATQGSISRAQIKLIEAIYLKIRARENSPKYPIFVGIDRNLNGLMTPQKLHAAEMDVVLITGDKDSLKKYDITERKKMTVDEQTGLFNLVNANEFVTADMFDAFLTNVENHRCWEEPYLDLIFYKDMSKKINEMNK